MHNECYSRSSVVTVGSAARKTLLRRAVCASIAPEELPSSTWEYEKSHFVSRPHVVGTVYIPRSSCTPQQVASVPLEGFVNGLAVSSTGKFLVAAVGQEHRLGRWEHQKKARNEVCVVQLPSGDGVIAMDTETREEKMKDVDGEEAD